MAKYCNREQSVLLSWASNKSGEVLGRTEALQLLGWSVSTDGWLRKWGSFFASVIVWKPTHVSGFAISLRGVNVLVVKRSCFLFIFQLCYVGKEIQQN